MTTRILTGIDLPLAPSCGSMILCDDLYRMSRAETEFMALPGDRSWTEGFDRITDLEAEKAPYGPGFDAYSAALTEQVATAISVRRPDVIHAQHLGFGLALAFARARGEVPMIAIAHGTDVIAAAQTEQARHALREIVAASHMVIVPTTFMRRAVADLVDEQFRDRITVAAWGIPRDRIATPAHYSGRSALRLLHAGRLDANKGTRFAIEALMHADNKEHTLTVIGDGPERDTLAAYAQSLGLNGRVTFEPFMPRADLWQRFEDFDAFAMTTLGLEAFGLVALEGSGFSSA